MKIDDYEKYYIQGSDHYLIPRDEFEALFDEMLNWKAEFEGQSSIINKAMVYIDKVKNKGYNFGDVLEANEIEHLLNILAEVE